MEIYRSLPGALKMKKIEIYSQGRCFMVTGDVLYDFMKLMPNKLVVSMIIKEIV